MLLSFFENSWGDGQWPLCKFNAVRALSMFVARDESDLSRFGFELKTKQSRLNFEKKRKRNKAILCRNKTKLQNTFILNSPSIWFSSCVRYSSNSIYTITESKPQFDSKINKIKAKIHNFQKGLPPDFALYLLIWLYTCIVR